MAEKVSSDEIEVGEDQVSETNTKFRSGKIGSLWKKLRLNRTRATLLAIFLLVASLFIYRLRLESLQKMKVAEQKIAYLAVVGISPQGTAQSLKPKIRIEFNLPVSAHHIGEFFQVAPHVEGNLVQGSSDKEIVFEPESTFAPGSYVTVILKKGLPSDSGKKLLDEYKFNFTIAYDANSIAFTNKGWSGRFMSFQASRGADVTLEVGSDINGPGLKIYKANSDLLLESLVYNFERREYSQKAVDTSKLTLVKEHKDIKDGQEINFKSDVGVYYLEGTEDGSLISSAWVSLNDIGIHLRQDDQNVYLAAQNFATGQGESGIDVTFYELNDKPKVVAQHTLNGIGQYPLVYPQRLDIVLAKKGNDTMIVPVSIPNSQAEVGLYQNLNQKNVIFLYTDRPIYKKGSKVAFRGIVRKDNDALYQLPSVDKVKVYMYRGPSEQKVEQILTLKEGGTFSGELTLPQDMGEGSWSLYATVDTEGKDASSEGYAYFDIFEYKKPSYGLDVEVEKGEYTKGDTVKATIKGSYFDGKPFSNQKVSYSVFAKDFYETEKATYNSSFKLNGWGGMCGGGGFEEWYGEQVEKAREISLDQNGKATVEFNTKDLSSVLSQELTFLVEKTDENGNKILAGKNSVVHQGEFNTFFRPGPSRILFGEEFTTVFYSETASGDKVANKKFSYEVSQETWVSGQTKPEKKILKSGSVETDSSGTGILREKLEKGEGDNNYYLISVYADDARGNKVEARKNIWFFSRNTQEDYFDWSTSLEQTQLKITSLKSSLRVGENANLEVISPEDMTVFVSFERGRVYDPHWASFKKGTNSFNFDVKDEFAPSISPTFSFFYNGQYYIEGMSLNVPALGKLITVEVSQDKDKYKPGETAVITVKTKDASGNPVSADLGIGVIDKAIFALRKNTAPPFHSSFFFFRGRSVNTSSSLSWIAMYDWRDGRGGGGDGGGSQFLKDVDTLYWNPTLKTDASGEVKIEVPVGSAQTTWKIIGYASTNDTKVGQVDAEMLVAN